VSQQESDQLVAPKMDHAAILLGRHLFAPMWMLRRCRRQVRGHGRFDGRSSNVRVPRMIWLRPVSRPPYRVSATVRLPGRCFCIVAQAAAMPPLLLLASAGVK
jgi:hypothetical protein